MIAIEAVAVDVDRSAVCRSVGISRASFYRRRHPVGPSTSRSPRAPSPRALVLVERQAVLDLLHSDRFVDQSPAEVHATLLEEQTYLCSPRTMYRVLAGAAEVRERRNQARHPAYTKPELVATGPNQVWSWDITKLKGPVKYVYFSLYVMLARRQLFLPVGDNYFCRRKVSKGVLPTTWQRSVVVVGRSVAVKRSAGAPTGA